ncbi:MAG TPA: rod shape-determining protein MreC [Vicinamibacterales bacterium]|nr:rod shape-determining protein MreC [Vicinamibacterales bacterium]
MPALDLKLRSSSYLFFAVVVAQLVLISAQVSTKTGMPILQAVAFGMVAEVQRVGAAATGAVGDVWTGYFELRGLQGENERLERELGQTRIALQQERALAQRSRNLEQLLDLRSRLAVQTTAADVIAAAATPEFRTVTIGKGTQAGLRPDMAVISPAGVVGRIIVPSAHAAKVQLLIDLNAAAGAVIERSRAQGVVVGTGSDTLRLDYVSGSIEIRTGDTVITSGIDGIYPKGFVIGRVETVERSGGAYGAITVRPAVDFSMLEEVLVVLTPPLPDGAGPAEAGR